MESAPAGKVAKDLLTAGKLPEAIHSVSENLRFRPTDRQLRTFLFELLCFSGNWDRAEKQLVTLAGEDIQQAAATLQYRAALECERERHRFFEAASGLAPSDGVAIDFEGSLNGNPFHSLCDADPQLGARLDLFCRGEYLRVPFAHIVLLEMAPPTRLRNLIWAPASIQTTLPEYEKVPDALVPVLYPFSWRHEDDLVKLGRSTAWVDRDGRDVPLGQRILLVDGDEIGILELRRLECHSGVK